MRRQLVWRSALFATSTLLAALACEVTLRWTSPIGDPFVTHTPHLRMVLQPNPAWMPHTISPARFTTDEQGFRVTRAVRYDVKPPGTFRVFLIGGSTTENLYIDDTRTFGAILERRLNEVLAPRGRQAEVINAARSGTGSADHFYLAWRVVSYEPDVIVYLMGINEMGPYIRNRFSPEATELKARARTWLFRSQLARRAYMAFRVTVASGREMRDSTGATLVAERAERQRAPPQRMPEALKQVAPSYRANVRRVLALHRRERVPAVFMTQPVLWQASLPAELDARLVGPLGDGTVRYANEELEQLMDTYNDVLREEAATEPVAHLVDLARLLPRDGETFVDEVHFTDPAQQKIADILFAGLMDARLVPLDRD